VGVVRRETMSRLFIVLMTVIALGITTDVAQGDDSLVCHEDEVAWPVNSTTEGAVEDAVGVSRLCMSVDDVTDYAYEAGSQSGYEYGYLDGYGAAVDEAERQAFARGYEAGYADAVCVVVNINFEPWPLLSLRIR
jgi:hypothetical protein